MIVVENVVGLVARYMLLQQAETIRVDRSDEQAAEQIQSLLAEPLFDPPGDAVLQLLRGPFREGERHDAPRGHTLVEQAHDSLRYDLGLA